MPTLKYFVSLLFSLSDTNIMFISYLCAVLPYWLVTVSISRPPHPFLFSPLPCHPSFTRVPRGSNFYSQLFISASSNLPIPNVSIVYNSYRISIISSPFSAHLSLSNPSFTRMPSGAVHLTCFDISSVRYCANYRVRYRTRWWLCE